jgi:uncharacterized integral membrane protein
MAGRVTRVLAYSEAAAAPGRGNARRHDMRWVHMAVIALLAIAVLIFAVQNLQSVTVAFLNFRLAAPLAVLAVVIYLLGMATGGSLWSLIRWALEGAKRPAAP